MTQDFKETLLKWVVGDYEAEEEEINVIYSDLETITNNFKQRLDTEFPNGYVFTDKLQAKNNNGELLGNFIITGYTTQGSTIKGFIIILDSSYNILAIKKKYSSNVDFGNFLKINVDEKGQFYAIELQSNNVRRLVLLNNIVATENYDVIIRTAYNLGTQQANLMTIVGIKKAENTGKYLIYGYYNGSSIIKGGKATEFTINVGSENEWVDYSTIDYNVVIKDCWVTWDAENKIQFKLYGKLSNEDKICILSTVTDDTELEIGTITLSSDIGDIYNFNIASLNRYQFYISIFSYDIDDEYRLRLIKYQSSITRPDIYNVINIDGQTSYDYANDVGIEFQKIGTEIFVHYAYLNNDYTYKHKLGRIYYDNDYDEIVYKKEIGNFDEGLTYADFIVIKQYNLYNFYYQNGNINYNCYQIFNENNYNGEPYYGNFPMSSASSILYNEDKPIFARNLYNKNVNGNKTISTIQIPNNFLNDVVIDTQTLISQCNNVMNSNSQEITTNIYEELLINFYNTIQIKNENDIDNPIINTNGAIRVNQSINQYGYRTGRIGRARIFYEDNTIADIMALQIDKIDSTHYQIQFNCYIAKPIIKIGLMTLVSPESASIVSLQDIDGSNFEVGKNYIVKQKVRIE